MKAVIIETGEDSGLMPLTADKPRLLLPIFGRPLLAYTLELLNKCGIHELMIGLHGEVETTRDRIAAGDRYGVKVDCSKIENRLGTAGSLLELRDFLDETFVLVYGAKLMYLDLAGIIETHKRSGGICTVASLKGVCSGKNVIYLLEPEILSGIPDGDSFDFEGDLLPSITGSAARVNEITMDGYAGEINAPGDLVKAHLDILRGDTGIHVPGQKMNDKKVWLDDGCAVHPLAEISGPAYIGRHTCVRSGAEIGDGAILYEGCLISERVRLSGSLLGSNVQVGVNTKITDSIIDDNCVIGSEIIIEKSVIIGKETTLGDGSVIMSGVRLAPRTKIPPMEIIRNETTQRTANK